VSDDEETPVAEALGDPFEGDAGAKQWLPSVARTIAQMAASIGRTLASPLSRRRSIPFIPQVERADCGVAVLAMVGEFYGVTLSMARLREATGTGRDGVTARALMDAARQLGFVCRAVRFHLGTVRTLPRGAILHWKPDHFVVLDAVTRKGANLVDPALGPRSVSWDALERSLTGVALLIQRGDAVAPVLGKRPRPWSVVSRLVDNSSGWLALLALSVLVRLSALLVPVLAGITIDRAGFADRTRLGQLVAATVGVGGVVLILSLIRGAMLAQLNGQTDVRLASAVTRRMMTLPFRFFERRATGDLFMRVRSGSYFRAALGGLAGDVVPDVVVVAVAVVVMCAIDVRVGVVAIMASLLQVVLTLGASRHLLSLGAHENEAAARANGQLVQLLEGIETLKVNGAEQRGLDAWSNALVEEMNASMARQRVELVSRAVTWLVRATGPAAVLLAGAPAAVDRSISVGGLVTAFAMASAASMATASVVGDLLNFSLLRGHVARLADVFDAEPERAGGRMVERRTFRGDIDIRGVWFRYAVNAPWVLKDVNLTVPAGSTLALVGRSGSGKSTLATLIATLDQPTTGRVLYDGIPSDEIDLRSIRSMIGTVTQQSFIFGGTIHENVSLRNFEGDPGDVVVAARDARVHDDIMAMPMGYNTPVGESGSSLSGGQRQRLALARALVGRPRLLILDEATSAVDGEVESQILRALAAHECTTILVAHRLSTIRHADQIALIEDGAVVDVGTHDELLQRCRRYATFMAHQGESQVPSHPMTGDYETPSRASDS